MCGLAQDGLAVVAEHTALNWPASDSQPLWFRARGVCKQVRENYNGFDATREWQDSLQLAAAGLELHASMVVIRDPAALDRAINALRIAPRWLRLRRDVRLAFPESMNGKVKNWQLEEAGTKHISWPSRFPTTRHARSMVMQLLRALSDQTLSLCVTTDDGPVDVCWRGLFPRQVFQAQTLWPDPTYMQCENVPGVLGRIMEAVNQLSISVSSFADAQHNELSSDWIRVVCGALRRRVRRQRALIYFHGSTWFNANSLHRSRLSELMRTLRLGAYMRLCPVLVFVHCEYSDYTETLIREFSGMTEEPMMNARFLAKSGELEQALSVLLQQAR